MAVRQNGDAPLKPRFPGDRATAPTPLEDTSEKAWLEFQQLQSGTDSVFPADDTTPGVLPPGVAGPRPGATTLEDATLLARRNNRCCPKPARWQAFQALLPSIDSRPPPQAISGQDWKLVTRMGKRLLLRDQIEWAAKAGVLPAAHSYLNGLPETDWEHFD
jgi:hypothetical protein